MTYQAILFDLDGTLLPMDLDQFTEGYFHLLAQTAAPYGYREETLVPALWKGVGAMVKNQGNRSNCEAFWETFAQVLGPVRNLDALRRSSESQTLYPKKGVGLIASRASILAI